MRHDLVPTRELALGVTRASEEQLAAAAPPFQHLALFAIGTADAGADRVRLQALDTVAVGIARASEELAETRAPPHHRLAALLADRVGRFGRERLTLLRHDIALVVADELLGVGALGIVGAGKELAVAPPLDLHLAVVKLALEPGRQALAFDGRHLLLGLAERFL